MPWNSQIVKRSLFRVCYIVIRMTNKDYRPTLAQLRTFVTIAEKKHFGTAAQALGISQPSLSQALASLEKGLGVQLIERSTRRVIVTPAGVELLPFAQATLEAADDFLTQALVVDDDLGGPLRIGVIPTIAPYLLPRFLTIVRQDLPALEPRIIEDKTDALIAALRDGQLDVAVVALPGPYARLSALELYEEPFLVVTPDTHPLAGASSVTIEDLDGSELLLLDDGHCLRDQVVSLCSTHASLAQASDSQHSNTQLPSQNLSEQAADHTGPTTASITASATRAASLPTIMQCVAGGLGISMIPLSARQSEASRPGLAVARFAPEVSAQRTIGLVYRNSSARGKHFATLGDILTRAYHESL